MTPHIEASKNGIAETVLMPGDPLRAEFLAENFLQNPVRYNFIRAMSGFTGEYRGKRVSVQGSGMGMPSMGIYSYELFKFYEVKNIIRIGTAGAIADALRVRDIVLVSGSCTDSNYASQYKLSGTFAPVSDFALLEAAAAAARDKELNFSVGNVLSSDTFYSADDNAMLAWKAMGVLAVEMECAALFMNAARLRKRALGILTVSDHIFTGESASADERRASFTDMMELALETALRI